MKIRTLLSTCVLFVVLYSCKSNTDAKTSIETKEKETTKVTDDVVTPIFSFSFVGCNRIDRHDQSSSNPSTANMYALERIYEDMDSLSQKPELFFFLGDLVLAESDTTNLDSQLNAWEKL